MTRGGRPNVPLSECRACKDPIVFARLETGKAMPLNPVPDREKGNVACRMVGRQLVGFVISHDRKPGPLDAFRMVPHYATCTAIERPTPKPTPEPDPSLF